MAQKYAPGRAIDSGTGLDDLGLTSIDRVELIMDLEGRLGTHIDEGVFASARTFGDLLQPAPPAESAEFPRWNRTWLARLVRRCALEGIFLPLTRLVARRIRVSGREHLASLTLPLIFAANHQSYLDTPVILASLPANWRHHIAPAMWKEYFKSLVSSGSAFDWRTWSSGALYQLLACFFNAYPVPKIDGIPVRVFWYSEPSFRSGITVVSIDGVPVRIYPPEKTIVECFKYRNKIGIDVAIEALRTYRERKRKPDFKAVSGFAKINRVERIMRPYLESIL